MWLLAAAVMQTRDLSPTQPTPSQKQAQHLHQLCTVRFNVQWTGMFVPDI